jgi:predicted nucleotidyltransferase
MTETVRKALSELKERLQSVYGNRLVAIILYGSVARGDYTEGSDVDVAIVLRGGFFAAKEINRDKAERFIESARLLRQHGDLASRN